MDYPQLEGRKINPVSNYKTILLNIFLKLKNIFFFIKNCCKFLLLLVTLKAYTVIYCINGAALSHVQFTVF